MAQQDNPHLIVTLTARPPVKIAKADWPVIAGAEDRKYDGQYSFQANRDAKWKLTVRQHKDGRTLVYGVWTYDSHYQGEKSGCIRAGELLTVEDASEECVGDIQPIISAVQRVGADLESRVPSGNYSSGVFPRLVHECIADLPAVELE